MDVSGVEVYWFDDSSRGGGCKTPASWRLLFKDGDAWKPIPGASGFGAEKDRFNSATFPPVKTVGLRIEAQLQPGACAGILEWRLAGPGAGK